MQIDLTDATVKRVLAWTDAGRGVTEDDVINRALDCYEQTSEHVPLASQPEDLIECFRKHRGKLRHTTIKEIVADRHRGLAS